MKKLFLLLLILLSFPVFSQRLNCEQVKVIWDTRVMPSRTNIDSTWNAVFHQNNDSLVMYNGYYREGVFALSTTGATTDTFNVVVPSYKGTYVEFYTVAVNDTANKSLTDQIFSVVSASGSTAQGTINTAVNDFGAGSIAVSYPSATVVRFVVTGVSEQTLRWLCRYTIQVR